MVNINGSTLVYGIIGNPVSHSLSPLFQNKFIQQIQHNAVYIPFHVEGSNLGDALAGLHAAHIQGINITVPHKEVALSFVHADSDAKTIGAVNTLKREGGRWLATNTDWQGFASVLQGLQVNPSQTPVLIFGAGGTSRAIVHALHHQKTEEILICNRSPERVESLVADLQQNYPNIQISTVPWQKSEVAKACQACNIIVNTSSIGLHDADTFPFKLQGKGAAIDAVYKPHGKTAFTKAASTGGYTSTDGLPMLLAQGLASFEFWHGQEPREKHLNLPDKIQSLQWVEQQLARQPLNMPGWRT